MDKNTYSEILADLDVLMTKLREKIDDKDFPLEKSQIYIACRELSHWLYDVQNIHDFKVNPPKLKLQAENGNDASIS